ncbi:MAG: class I tRNA ligase family protein [Deltaproteobacteria bacterium]|nr:class I tRNA ligase family protein [Deltaproteobacteria bacterium]
MTLRLYNTMTRRKDVFRTREEGIVRMFTCGPSIYGRPHLGNYRTFAWEDVLERYLEHLGYEVQRHMNLTDVEDKAIAEAEKEGTSVESLTRRKEEQFHEESRLLRIQLPTGLHRSSRSIRQAVKLIQRLMAKGLAYRHGKDVFYDPTKFEGFGRLFRLDMTRWPKERRRFRKDTYPGRRWNMGDFILWHGYRAGDAVYWETEIGKGRPSWNIQDPAVITEHLGFSIDIACGGIDNLYRHHDYNIAVVEGVSGVELAPFWIHGEHLLVNGKKMSKSLGNITYPEDLRTLGYSGEHIRFYLIFGHHREKINLTDSDLAVKAKELDRLRNLAERLCCGPPGEGTGAPSEEAVMTTISDLVPHFEFHMNNDLDVRGAVQTLLEDLEKLAPEKTGGRMTAKTCSALQEELQRIDRVLQVLFPLQD